MLKKENLIEIIIYSASFFIIGFLTFGMFINWESIHNTFYDIKITDIAELFLIVIIGYFISYHINIKSNKSIKVSESFYNLFVSLEKLSIEIQKIHEEYVEISSTDRNKYLIGAIRNFSIQLSMIDEISCENHFDVCHSSLKKIEQRYFELKSLLTGGDFGTIDSALSRMDILRINELFVRLFANIKKAQICCFR